MPPYSALGFYKAVPIPAYYGAIISAATGMPALAWVTLFQDSGFVFIIPGVFLLSGATCGAVTVDNQRYLIVNGFTINGRCGDFPVGHVLLPILPEFTFILLLIEWEFKRLALILRDHRG
jgi:hypothetical protein